MKDFFNRRQRFSLRKYSIGVCSVLLGTALFAAHGAQADELASTDTPVTPEASVTGDDSSSLVTTSTTATQQTDPTSVVSASAETSASATLDLTPSVTTSADRIQEGRYFPHDFRFPGQAEPRHPGLCGQSSFRQQHHR